LVILENEAAQHGRHEETPLKVTRTILFFVFFFVARNQNLNVLSLLVRKTRTDWLVNEMRILRPAAGMKRIIDMSLNFWK